MAEVGEGNIKVVVRCRPLNTRGMLVIHTSYGHTHLFLVSAVALRSRRTRAGGQVAHPHAGQPNIPGPPGVRLIPGHEASYGTKDNGLQFRQELLVGRLPRRARLLFTADVV